MKKTNKFSSEVRERAVRLVHKHRGIPVAVGSGGIDLREDRLSAADVAGMGKPVEVDSDVRDAVTATEAQRVKELNARIKNCAEPTRS